ncbi:MerR family transcriptional regulator [Hoeflea sp.]|uniref:MerR family transcriptional regulator n=1 Tax=Hoeflea sp. TaxID=1940281 RepID=UPI003B515C18
MFSIGELSRRCGVKIPTIRYYEQMGLITAPERSEGNQRRYSSDGLKRLSFIRHSRELGFSIEDIRGLLELSQHPEQPCRDAHKLAAQRLSDVRARIARLQRLERELKRISDCDADSIAHCAVIETLADHSLCETEH